MGRIAIKDSSYRIVGYIDTDSSGKQTALDASYKHVGYYDPRANVTKDASFNIIAHGNTLASLIHR
jgi:hypothetical protein